MPDQYVHGLLFSGGIGHPYKQQYATFVHLLLQILGIALMNDGGDQRPDDSNSDYSADGSEQCAAEHRCRSDHSTRDAGCANKEQAATQCTRSLSNGFLADECDRRRLCRVGILVSAGI